MKIATFNVNGINGRLPVLLRWLEEAQPDVACLQELKAPDARFPSKEIEKAGYGAIWHGQKAWNGVAILARGREPIETRRDLPGDPDDDQSRYVEAAVEGMLIGCLYLPNGNPAPGPKFDYKLRWLKRLNGYAAELLELDVPIMLVGDFNVIPTDLDVYNPHAGATTRCSVQRFGTPFMLWPARVGPTPFVPCTLTNASTRSGTISGMLGAAMPDCAWIISC